MEEQRIKDSSQSRILELTEHPEKTSFYLINKTLSIIQIILKTRNVLGSSSLRFRFYVIRHWTFVPGNNLN